MTANEIEVNKIIKRLGKIPAVIQNRVVVGGNRAGAVEIKKKVQEYVPVDTGRLKKSIKVKKLRQKSYHKFIIHRITTANELFYGIFVHQGTDTIKPVPFMTLGYENGAQSALNRMKSYMKTRVEKEIKKIKV